MILLALIAAVSLGGAFGEAEASTISVSATSMVIDLSVEILVPADSVLAHLSSDGETMLLPLVERQAGVYGLRSEMPLKNWVVVFEILGPEGELSQPVSLGFLGAHLGTTTTSSVAGTTTRPDDDSEARRWGFLALALAAGSLSALAFWVLGGRDDESGDPEEE